VSSEYEYRHAQPPYAQHSPVRYQQPHAHAPYPQPAPPHQYYPPQLPGSMPPPAHSHPQYSPALGPAKSVPPPASLYPPKSYPPTQPQHLPLQPPPHTSLPPSHPHSHPPAHLAQPKSAAYAPPAHSQYSNSFAPSFTAQPAAAPSVPLWGSPAYASPFTSAAGASASLSSISLNRAPSPHTGQSQAQFANQKMDVKSGSGSAASAASFAKDVWDDPTLAAYEDTRAESPPPTDKEYVSFTILPDPLHRSTHLLCNCLFSRMEDEDEGKYNDKYSTNKDEFDDDFTANSMLRPISPGLIFDEYVLPSIPYFFLFFSLSCTLAELKPLITRCWLCVAGRNWLR
jgi:hypothetical protein